MTVLAANTYKTNSDLMIACRELGYLSDALLVADVTFGKGTWWKKWMPLYLVASDILDMGSGHADFRHLPYQDDSFDVVAFDPPYVAVGGRKTSTIGAFNEAYGLVEVPKTVKGLHKLIVEGLLEAHRVLKPRGLVLFKAMDYVTSGTYTRQGEDAIQAVKDFFTVHDELLYLRRPGPQPTVNLDGSPRRQVHARRNYSHLYILRAIK